MTELLKKAYDPDTFIKDLRKLTVAIQNYLKNIQENPTIKSSDPIEEKKYWMDYFKRAFTYEDLIKQSLERSIHIHNPKYIGHQVSPPAFMTIQQGLLSDLLNNGMGIYEMGSVAVVWEQIIIKKLIEVAGFNDSASGFLTSGGSLANLTALLCARSKYFQEGSKQGIIVSEMAHYSVSKSAKILNLELYTVPVSMADFSMNISLLEDTLQKAKDNKFEIIAVVGSICSTATGSFDDLIAIRKFCDLHDLWMHADGAHGGAMMFSDKYKYLITGIEQADSMLVDFHKMLMTPALATALIFKNGQDSYRTYFHKAEYLWQNDQEEWYNLAKRTFECTKFMMSFKILPLWERYGNKIYDDYVTTVVDNAHKFAKQIELHPNFEIAMNPQCNIVCFRHIKGDNLNKINANIRQKLIEEGEFYIVQTNLKGELYLRCSIMNPFTEESHFVELLNKLDNLATAELM